MRLILAPMEGVIDHTMRHLLTQLGGYDRCVTEFVRVTALLLPPRVFYRYCPELHSGGKTPSGTPVYLQLLGGRPEVLADNAARAAELGAPGIDLNFGCPARLVNKNDGGSVLLREPDRIHRIVDAVRAAVPQQVPVTVKMRLGYENSELLQANCQAVAAGGANELAVHARTKVNGYRAPAYWSEIARVREWIDIPVVANGEIWSPQDARRCRESTGCTDLMLGRGALARPDLARLLQADWIGDVDAQPVLGWSQVLQLLQAYFELLQANYAPRYQGNPIKQWLVYLRQYFPQAAALFDQVKRLRDPQLIRAALI
jgi:tRNA-dihydrouridine synthase C